MGLEYTYLLEGDRFNVHFFTASSGTCTSFYKPLVLEPAVAPLIPKECVTLVNRKTSFEYKSHGRYLTAVHGSLWRLHEAIKERDSNLLKKQEAQTLQVS